MGIPILLWFGLHCVPKALDFHASCLSKVKSIIAGRDYLVDLVFPCFFALTLGETEREDKLGRADISHDSLNVVGQAVSNILPAPSF